MKEGRLESLDALRGFDMLMIMGFGGLVSAVCALFGYGSDCWLVEQFRHVEWDGLRFEDTIFPLFLFLSGVSWPFSHAKKIARGMGTAAIVRGCLKRAAILVVLGLVYNGLLDGQLRVGAVLVRIGLAWCGGALLYMACPRKVLMACALGIPIAYWALLCFVPAPDALTLAVPESQAVVKQFGTGPFSIVGNLSGWIDRTFMPGVLMSYTGIADNQSALGVIPAIGTALLGILSGDYIRRTRTTLSGGARVGRLLLAAAGLVALGLFVAYGCGRFSMPLNKKLWSASFVFVVGGYSVAMLAVFHGVIDVLGYRTWAFFFRVIGMNAITIYLAQRFIPFKAIAKSIFGGLAHAVPPVWGTFILALAQVLLCWLFLYFLHKKNVYLKV